MTKLKLGPIADDKPIKVTLELPASLHRDLTAYAEILGREAGHAASDPVRLIVTCWNASLPPIAASPRRGVGRHRPAFRSHEAIKVSHNLDFTRSPNPAG